MSSLKTFALLQLIALTVACATAPEESFTSVVDNPTPLILELPSYSSPADIRALLPDTSTWTVLSESGSSGNRPPFDHLLAQVQPFMHIGHQGELQLRFFNGRLMTTLFYPDDPQAYLRSLQGQGVQVGDQNEIAITPATRIWSAVDSDERLYVAWGDSRLYEQEKRWVSLYS